MIVTVTPNTALDVTYTVDGLRCGDVHRVSDVRSRAGGKGVNVARVLHALGADVRAILTAGGATGTAVVDDLTAVGVAADVVPIARETRRTTTVLADDGSVTLLNEPGPRLDGDEWQAFAAAVRSRNADVLVCSGSLPPGAGGYAELLGGTPSILDTSGDALLAGLAGRPSVVKPNADELREVTGLRDPVAAAAELRKAGAGAVVVSLGAEGLLAVTPSGSWHAAPSTVLRGNTTGAGDAVVAALALGLSRAEAWPDILRRAVALSGAAVLGPLAGDVDLAHYHREQGLVAVRARPEAHRTDSPDTP
ncbi:1-phosphofructokinase family hexose kinase [Amycolatopsis regifaucium]|uniref:1-phosphofructokinase n=1 Tax=Amycolatopsis regifaucium TaxID=546365 RepID=A0A154MWS5_9PSEU|nr:1-phosphofructokinase family hexose kinase [Amycolatopsis regifaucium]KZB88725.1 1-phosphofructokinase [Amycolatopsis regifaucium]OKA07102.1 1-phosphofructokinase [Amycolatopsis regifaucium]SFI58443.1 tagatose 6-phosphate kinase [Amycolatopsis regifaucium]